MSKTFIINLLIFALLTYGVLIFLRCKKAENRNRQSFSGVEEITKEIHQK